MYLNKTILLNMYICAKIKREIIYCTNHQTFVLFCLKIVKKWRECHSYKLFPIQLENF